MTFRLWRNSCSSGDSCQFKLTNEALLVLCVPFLVPFVLSVLVLISTLDPNALVVVFLPVALFAGIVYCLKRNEIIFYIDKGVWGRVGSPALMLRRTDEIHALQLLSRLNRNRRGDYFSFELNLVLSDASRVNLTHHNALLATRADSQALSDALGVPLWDAVDHDAEEWGLRRKR